jgi:hypothetical protein
MRCATMIAEVIRHMVALHRFTTMARLMRRPFSSYCDAAMVTLASRSPRPVPGARY